MLQNSEVAGAVVKLYCRLTARLMSMEKMSSSRDPLSKAPVICYNPSLRSLRPVIESSNRIRTVQISCSGNI